MNVVRKIMHFLIHNGIIFTVGVMCLVHVTLLVIFSVAGVHPLVRFNVASVIIYVIGLKLRVFLSSLELVSSSNS